jgi:hypothetical protein
LDAGAHAPAGIGVVGGASWADDACGTRALAGLEVEDPRGVAGGSLDTVPDAPAGAWVKGVTRGAPGDGIALTRAGLLVKGFGVGAQVDRSTDTGTCGRVDVLWRETRGRVNDAPAVHSIPATVYSTVDGGADPADTESGVPSAVDAAVSGNTVCVVDTPAERIAPKTVDAAVLRRTGVSGWGGSGFGRDRSGFSLGGRRAGWRLTTDGDQSECQSEVGQ